MLTCWWSSSQGRGRDLFAIEEELSALLEGRKVDLVTAKSLNHRIRARVAER